MGKAAPTQQPFGKGFSFRPLPLTPFPTFTPSVPCLVPTCLVEAKKSWGRSLSSLLFFSCSGLISTQPTNGATWGVPGLWAFFPKHLRAPFGPPLISEFYSPFSRQYPPFLTGAALPLFNSAWALSQLPCQPHTFGQSPLFLPLPLATRFPQMPVFCALVHCLAFTAFWKPRLLPSTLCPLFRSARPTCSPDYRFDAPLSPAVPAAHIPTLSGFGAVSGSWAGVVQE